MLEKVRNFMDSFVVSLNESSISDMYNNIPQGKMLRAKLILEIAKESEDAAKLAAIVEMIHMASLLHDDVIDAAVTRRGLKSFNAEFGDKNAVMMGDTLYSCAFAKLTEFPQTISSCISNAVSLLSIGEIFDMSLAKSFNANEEKYFKMIYYKTASLIEASAKSAAILAGLDENDFSLYGKNLGLAFQIKDDILDVVSSSSVLGKPAMDDFKEGKVTLPYIYLYEQCSDKDRKHLLTLYKKRLNSYELGWINDKMAINLVIEKCVKKAEELGKEALVAVKKYNFEGLEKIVEQMVKRDF